MGIVGQRIPLANEDLEILVHIRLELPNALGREGVRDGLALTSVLGAVPRIEEAAIDAHKGIIVFAVPGQPCVLSWMLSDMYELGAGLTISRSHCRVRI